MAAIKTLRFSRKRHGRQVMKRCMSAERAKRTKINMLHDCVCVCAECWLWDNVIISFVFTINAKMAQKTIITRIISGETNDGHGDDVHANVEQTEWLNGKRGRERGKEIEG